MKLKVKKLTETAKLPTRGSSQAAGLDLFADVGKKVLIMPGETVMVHTGISIEIPEGYFGAIYARSGLATKRGLRPANCVGIIDSDYRGEIIVALHNDSLLHQYSASADDWYLDSLPSQIEPGERIAQLVIQPYLPVEPNEVEELSPTERGAGGFGSTGTN